jgi:hypothetical protein
MATQAITAPIAVTATVIKAEIIEPANPAHASVMPLS